jgi:hypothetical protein
MPWSGCRNWAVRLEDPVPPIQTPIWANIGSDWCDAKMDSWNTPWCLPVRCATKHYDVPKWDEGTLDWRSCGSKRSFRNFHSVQDGGGLGNDGPDRVVYRSAIPSNGLLSTAVQGSGMIHIRHPDRLENFQKECSIFAPPLSQKPGISKPSILASRPTLTT